MKGFVIDYHLSPGLQHNLSGLRLKETSVTVLLIIDVMDFGL